MSLIVAARFDSWDQAGAAARELSSRGFPDESLHTFYVNSPGAHDQHPLGGDRTADPDAKGAQVGAMAGAAVLALAGAAIFALIALWINAGPYVIIAAGAVGAYLGSLIGALRVAGAHRRRALVNPLGAVATATAPASQTQSGGRQSRTAAADTVAGYTPIRHAGVLLAVQTDPEQEASVARILADAGGMDVERAQGRWANGSWADFDPVKSPKLSEKVAQSV